MTNGDDASNRRVNLRAERNGLDSRYLDAYLDDQVNLHIDGQDLGPSTAIVSSDGEYEWFEVIPAADVPRLKELLGANPGEDILAVLERSWTGARSYDLERILRQTDFHMSRHVWSG